MKKVELSIKEFVVFFLRKWPVLLASMLVFGILFGVLGEGPFQQQMLIKQAEYDTALENYEIAMADYEKALKTYAKAVEKQKVDYEKALKDYPKAVEKQKVDYEKALKDYPKAVEKQKVDYEKALEEYERTPELNANKLTELKKEREEINAYLDDSILMNIDPDNKQVASITIQISIPGSTNYNTLRLLLERYVALANGVPLQSLYSDFLQKEFEEKYLLEVYSVLKGTADILTITSFGNEYIDAEKCVQAVYDYLLSKQDAITDGSGVEHSISIISRKNSRVIDTALKTQQAKQIQQLDTIESEIEALETLVLEKPEEPEALEPPEEPEALIAPEDPEMPEEPVKPEEPYAPVISSYDFVSQIPFGMAAGLAVGILALCMLYVLQLPMQLPEQIQRQLKIRYLGGVKKRANVLDLGAKLAGSLRMSEEEKAIELISANVRDVIAKNKKILLTGSAPADAAKSFMDNMQKLVKRDDVTFSYAKDVDVYAESVTMLSNADAVLLVERLNHSRLRKVNQAKERIEMSGKEILGYVLV